MDNKKIAQGVRLILEGIGDDANRNGLKRTPARFAEMCAEIFSGINQDLQLSESFSEATGQDGIIIKNIRFYSVCEHHLLPFFGNVEVSYIPKNNRITGFSNIAKIVDHYSQRLQIQERLTAQIADEVMAYISPKHVNVIVEATQLCASMRGDHKKELMVTTEATRGETSV